MSNDVLMTQVLWPNFISTLIMVGCSALLSTVLGFLLATVLIVTNKQGLKPNPSVYRVLDFIINVVRSFPFIILMVALMPVTRSLVGTTIGTTAAIVPLTFAMAPYVARLFENNMLEVNPYTVDAAKSFGASNTQIIFKVLLVEAFPSLISSLTLAIISVLGYTAMAGTVGAGGLGAVAITYGYQNFDDRVMYSTVLILIVFVQLIQVIGSRLYKKLKA
ncbi:MULTISPECIES: methionine ABC transporter permease [Enterococcus]|uniref:D-methionine transport system permease n=1 Tax=Candidatus Enterococcus ferrettii TaxID=2815324 RepID=A0ABV0EVM5_9ENTE|nr:methionine ABC transporter permease [Enterococcus sp. 665A]MBO1342216.1 ABC transporter permease [Enterococcus sp. 665A]